MHYTLVESACQLHLIARKVQSCLCESSQLLQHYSGISSKESKVSSSDWNFKVCIVQWELEINPSPLHFTALQWGRVGIVTLKWGFKQLSVLKQTSVWKGVTVLLMLGRLILLLWWMSPDSRQTSILLCVSVTVSNSSQPYNAISYSSCSGK